jgi:PAS domain S-box-containing protein
MSSIETPVALDALPCGFVQLDEEDRVVLWNQRIERWTGLARAAVVGRRLSEVFSENPAIAPLLAEVRAHRRPRVLAQIFHRRLIPVTLPPGHLSGLTEMQQECHLVPLESPAGHIAISILDVTPLVVGQQRSRVLVAERNRAQQVVRRRAEFLTVLNQTTLELLTRRNVPELLQALAERCSVLLGSEHVEISLLEGSELVVRAFSKNCEYLKGDRAGRDDAIMGWQAIDSRQPVVVRCYAEHPTQREIYRTHRLQAAASIPIIRGTECLGVFGLARTTPGRYYSDEDVEHAVMLARMAALVLHNASTHEEADRAAAARTVALRESEEKFRAVFDQSPIMISLLAMPSARIVELNSAAVAAFGYSRAEAVGRTPEELHLWVDADLRTEYLKRLVAQRSVTGFESELRRKDGTTFTVLHNGCIVSIAGRLYNIASLQDITDRKQSELVRDRAAALLRATLESTADGILVVNTHGHITTYNRVFAEMWQIDHHGEGEPVEEERILAVILGQLVVPEDFLASVRDLYAGSEADVIDVLHCKDGRVIERFSRPQLIGDRPAGRIWSYRDSTERRRAEAALRDSEERFRVLAEVSPVGIFSTDSAGQFNFVNRRWCEFAGLPPHEAMGTGWIKALHPEDHDRVLAEWKQALRSGETSATEYRFVRPDGAVTWLVGQSRRQVNPDGSRAGFVGTITDVTSLKRAEEDRRQAEAQLRQMQKMESIGTLAGGIAHDFNNILTGTFGFADLARLELSPAHPAHAWLDRITASAERARELVRQILTFSRKREGNRTPLHLHPAIAETLGLLRSTLPSNVALETQISGEVPAVLADATQIHQIVLNLCTNAWQAMPSRGGRIIVALDACHIDAAQAATHLDLHVGPYARLTVTDDGSGMDAATIEQIFEPFFTRRETGSGTGLGLAVVHGIMKLHEGAILVRSNPGKGTTFELFFPAVADEVRPAPPPPPKDVPSGLGQRVMLIDDDAISGFAHEKMIETLNYSVQRFSRPEPALATFSAAPDAWDLVVSDLAMPGMNGDELVAKMRQIRPNLPVIIVTGYIETARQVILEKTAACAVLHKPLSRHELARALAAYVRRPA